MREFKLGRVEVVTDDRTLTGSSRENRSVRKSVLDNSIEMIDQEKYTFRPIEQKVEIIGKQGHLNINLKQ